MANRTGTLRIQHKDLNINANIRYNKLNADKFTGTIKKKDKKTGHWVKSQTYSKETDEALNNTGRRYVSVETGEVVPNERLEKHEIVEKDEDGNITESRGPIEEYDSTIGGGKELPIEKWITPNERSDYLVDRVYEIYGEEKEDEAQLWELAQWIRDNQEYPVARFIWNSSPYKSIGVIHPYIEDDGFTVMMDISKAKVGQSPNLMEKREEVQNQVEDDEDKVRASQGGL